MRNDPRTRHPSLLQISPYVNLITEVYKSKKRARSHPLHEEDPTEKVEGTGEGNLLRFVTFTVTTQVVYIFLYAVPPTAHHDIMLTMHMTPDVGPPTVPGGAPDAGVAMGSPLPTDTGTVDTASCSEALSTSTIQVWFLCTTTTSDHGLPDTDKCLSWHTFVMCMVNWPNVLSMLHCQIVSMSYCHEHMLQYADHPRCWCTICRGKFTQSWCGHACFLAY